jgi:hypothetical protein
MVQFLFILAVISGLTDKINGRVIDENRQISNDPVRLDNIVHIQNYH